MIEIRECECGINDWSPIPDSLACACTGCGRVLVNKRKGRWKKGASIQKWLNDRCSDLSPLEDPNDK
jgi:hypothetical protein